jgi:hypothetical protein
METLTSFFAILTGLLLRLMIPIVGTVILIYLLRKLDAHWQAEAELTPVNVEKVECWKIKGCSEEQRENCAGATASLPCWQVHRQPNGYLQEACISCQVFVNAPVPALKIEPRRM